MIDVEEAAIVDARRNAERDGIQNAVFTTAKDKLLRLLNEKAEGGHRIVNPPRGDCTRSPCGCPLRQKMNAQYFIEVILPRVAEFTSAGGSGEYIFHVKKVLFTIR
jgi:hypothetical protein